MAGSLTITGQSTGDPAGTRTLPSITIAGPGSIGETLAVPLTSGDNTYAVPSGSVGAVIIPPGSGTATLKFRTNTNNADGGLVISSTQATVYTFPGTPPTSLIINASTSQSAFLNIWFW